ncbi:MAG: dihydropteroate synthase [Bacteriovoracia bacterium]
MNITPNSFSDGGEILNTDSLLSKLTTFRAIHALDIGAESTAPMNDSISAHEEWGRWQMVLPLIPSFSFAVSADTYHPETISHLVKFWIDQKIKVPLIWNDISGKFDESVSSFLNEGELFHYVLCHNRAPSRDLSGKHMNYVQENPHVLEELKDFFIPHIHERVIFDPCLGFSKSYEENWKILDNFHNLQAKVPHSRWLLGFSRKSFLRKKLGMTDIDRIKLDQYHLEILQKILKVSEGELWIRTHRPELIK